MNAVLRRWAVDDNKGLYVDFAAEFFDGKSPLDEKVFSKDELNNLKQIASLIAQAQVMAQNLSMESVAALGNFMKTIQTVGASLKSNIEKYGDGEHLDEQQKIKSTRQIRDQAAELRDQIDSLKGLAANNPALQSAVNALQAKLAQIAPQKTENGKVIKLFVVRTLNDRPTPLNVMRAEPKSAANNVVSISAFAAARNALTIDRRPPESRLISTSAAIAARNSVTPINLKAETVREMLAVLSDKTQPAAVRETIATLIEGKQPLTVSTIISALAEKGQSAAIGQVMTVLADKGQMAGVQMIAAALAETRQTPVINAVMAALAESNPQVAAHAIVGMAANNQQIAAQALMALAEIQPPATVQMVITALAETSNKAAIQIVTALAETGQSAVLNTIIAALVESNPKIAAQAITVIAENNQQIAAQVLTRLAEKSEPAVFKAVAAFIPEKTLQPIKSEGKVDQILGKVTIDAPQARGDTNKYVIPNPNPDASPNLDREPTARPRSVADGKVAPPIFERTPAPQPVGDPGIKPRGFSPPQPQPVVSPDRASPSVARPAVNPNPSSRDFAPPPKPVVNPDSKLNDSFSPQPDISRRPAPARETSPPPNSGDPAKPDTFFRTAEPKSKPTPEPTRDLNRGPNIPPSSPREGLKPNPEPQPAPRYDAPPPRSSSPEPKVDPLREARRDFQPDRDQSNTSSRTAADANISRNTQTQEAAQNHSWTSSVWNQTKSNIGDLGKILTDKFRSAAQSLCTGLPGCPFCSPKAKLNPLSGLSGPK